MESANICLLFGLLLFRSASLVWANFGAGGLRLRRVRLAPKWPSPRAPSGVVDGVLGTRSVKHVLRALQKQRNDLVFIFLSPFWLK